MKKVKEEISRFWKSNRFLLKPFLALLVIYLMGVSAIILAGVHYADDVARTTYGYAGWNGFSRYVDTVLAHILHADGYLTNIAPLPQLLAVAILALASVMMICVISNKEVFKLKWTKWIWQVIAVVPLALSPYMLECLSYQYDAPYMAISVFCAVVPLTFRKQKRWMYILAIVIGILMICMTYQAAVGIFLMLVAIIAIKEWSTKENNKEILKFILISVGIFLVTLLVFQKILMKPRDAYASNSLPAISELAPTFFSHLGQYFSLVFSDFKILWLVMMGLIGVFFVFLFVVNSKRNKVASLVIAMMGGCAIIVLAFAFYAVLDKPLYATRAMYPLGASLAIMGIYVASGEKKMGVVLKVPMAVLVWCFFVFAFTYGNALKEQNIYRNMVADMVISDLNEIMVGDAPRTIQTTGSIGFSPVILHMPQDYKILDRLLMPTYSRYVPWMAYKVTLQNGISNLVYDESVDLVSMGLPMLKETALYNIYGDSKNILVEFKDKHDFNVVF
ncbi:glucosyltransferase domain-containing protein [Candidatus Saccharibacteria bacterium]|nr:glucosyltransferase domain-containing protein [Candidatus Saccharibacteria bacterium]